MKANSQTVSDWNDAHRIRRRYISYKGTARTFVKHYATKDDLLSIQQLVRNELESRGEEND